MPKRPTLARTADRWSVERWMSAPVRAVAPETPLVRARRLMERRRIRHLPVVDRGRLVGIVSDRDVLAFLGGDPGRVDGADGLFVGRSVRVADAMTRKPYTVSVAADVRAAAEILCREKVGALPVLADGELVGIVSAEDLLWAFLETTREAAYLPDEDDDGFDVEVSPF
ncbi:MAG TPA: CBS domain-containing protein [Planctomycetota bacterium]|nr:CBS domain-containing protein [Planctomycetota bacterium]